MSRLKCTFSCSEGFQTIVYPCAWNEVLKQVKSPNLKWLHTVFMEHSLTLHSYYTSRIFLPTFLYTIVSMYLSLYNHV